MEFRSKILLLVMVTFFDFFGNPFTFFVDDDGGRPLGGFPALCIRFDPEAAALPAARRR
jgi:hypothetical protein